MHAGGILPDIFRDNTPAGIPLAGIPEPSRRICGSWYAAQGLLPRRREEIHKFLVNPKLLHHQVIADTLTPDNTKTGEVTPLCTSGEAETPCPVQGGKTGAELVNLIVSKFPGTGYTGSLQVTPDFRVFLNIHEAEDQTAGKGGDTVTDVPDLFQEVLNGYLFGKNKGIEPPDDPAFPDSSGGAG